MSSKADNEKQKLIQDKCQIILGNLLREEDNKYCVDCDAKGPRWASWNLGIFLCIRCAGIHRNLGVHISKVKSVNLDTWTAEQVAYLQQMGNSQARAVYEANLPESFRRPQTDSSLEAFIRAKYEQRKYIAKEWVPPPAPKPAFDIEEEKRKEREKKKKSKISNVIEIPTLPQHPAALPRPHSTGPHSPVAKPVQLESAKPNTEQVPESTDLLNLGSSVVGDSIFDTFLSASVAPSAVQITTKTNSNDAGDIAGSISAEEADFFNQPANVDNRANKMTKESILSLYGSSSCQMPTTQHITPVYGVPGGMYMNPQAFSQVGMNAYPSVPTQGSGVSITGVYNSFASLGPTIRPDARHQPNMWFGVPPSGRDESLIMTHGLGQVTQQMANLQLTGQTWNLGLNSAPVNASGLVIGSSQTPGAIVWPAAPNSQNQQNQGIPKNHWP